MRPELRARSGGTPGRRLAAGAEVVAGGVHLEARFRVPGHAALLLAQAPGADLG